MGALLTLVMVLLRLLMSPWMGVTRPLRGDGRELKTPTAALTLLSVLLRPGTAPAAAVLAPLSREFVDCTTKSHLTKWLYVLPGPWCS